MACPLHVIILAAGQGSRMKSSLPKVLHPLAGQPLLQHVVDRARDLNAERTHLVVGHGAEQVRAAIAGDDLDWALQAEQLGTGHAVDQALPAVPDDARVLVLYGDVPLLCADTLRQLADSAGPENLAILTVELDDPTGYGRILRDEQGGVQAIVEEKDASQAQRSIREVNTGILAAPARSLKRWLPALSADNAQGEYYLTDIIAMAAAEGQRIQVAQPQTPEEVQGVNDRGQLADLERAFQRRQARALMAAGVTLADPERLDVRGTLNCARDVQIDVGCVFEGHVSLAENVRIGPYCCLRDVELGPGTVLASHSVLEGVRAAGDNQIGPFARLRPGTELAAGARVGNFVETKKALIGEGSKVNHLTYIGDTRMGARVNVGAGTITCNYDGANKHLTELGDGVFIGSNSSLVAPVRVDDNATIGAGSTITRDVDADQLAVARGRQRNIDGWSRPDRKKS